ncbi:MAG: flagellar biosynthetic protein FliR [Alphaproteobacteria bacterium]|nr:flagellar biosynthetic protein FliR [Alphaproteobacteria bacterium]
MLEQFLVSQLFAFLLVFCRLGSALMLLPGFGETYIPTRVRLLLAVLFSMLLAPVLTNLPAAPSDMFSLVSLISAEILTGFFIGGISRIMIAAIHMAGMIIAYQSSLASALTQDVTQAQAQGTSLGNLLGFTALVLLFATDLHHLMLRGLADSYTLFLPGKFPNVAEFSNHAVQSMSAAFRMAMQMSAPHLIIGLIIYLAAGIIAKLMPNIQIFFIMMSPQLLISFIILMLSFSAIMLWYMEYFKTTLSGFLAP